MTFRIRAGVIVSLGALRATGLKPTPASSIERDKFEEWLRHPRTERVEAEYQAELSGERQQIPQISLSSMGGYTSQDISWQQQASLETYMNDIPWGVTRQQFAYGLLRMQHIRQDLEQHCTKPKEGEKIVYFVRHATKMNQTAEDPDPLLTEEGFKEAASIAKDPIFQAAFSDDERYQVKRIMVSPTRRTMLTAMLAFQGNAVAEKAAWEIYAPLRELYTVSSPAQGEVVLNEHKGDIGADVMLQQYTSLDVDISKEYMPEEGFERKISNHFLDAPEQNFIVVSHNSVMDVFMGHFLKPGQAMAFNLRYDPEKKAGHWHHLSDPAGCWPGLEHTPPW